MVETAVDVQVHAIREVLQKFVLIREALQNLVETAVDVQVHAFIHPVGGQQGEPCGDFLASDTVNTNCDFRLEVHRGLETYCPFPRQLRKVTQWAGQRASRLPRASKRATTPPCSSVVLVGSEDLGQCRDRDFGQPLFVQLDLLATAVSFDYFVHVRELQGPEVLCAPRRGSMECKPCETGRHSKQGLDETGLTQKRTSPRSFGFSRQFSASCNGFFWISLCSLFFIFSISCLR